MRCSRCTSENREGIRFCEECGGRLAQACVACGAEILPDKRFCGGCGTPVAAQPTERFASPERYTPNRLAEKILTSRSALEGERKQVTVLFADLKGSMELMADRDPEEARTLLDPVLEHMIEAVHRYEGTVNQVMGDGIMALFGAPVAHEDHAVRACYAALQMQESVRHYAEQVRRVAGTPVSIRVGLNSGDVVVRSIGNDLRMDYTAVGQTTHLAARMEQAALPGSILLTANTLRLVEGYIQVRPLGPIAIKGLKDPVEVYDITEVGPARSRLQAAAVRGLTRFVGREAELERLWQAMDQAAGGHGEVVALVGEAGVGKSRLYLEFTQSHRVADWLILEGGSVSYGKATPYLPVINLLKAYFQVGARDDGRKIREKITGKLLTLERSLEPELPVLLALLDVPVEDPQWRGMDPPQRRHRTLEAVKRLLLRESQVQPVLLLFEDLHWVDSETQALLDGLVESLPSARILLLVNYRPEYQHRWGGKTYYRQLRIDSLAAASAEELLSELVGVDPALGPLKQFLIERTEGNPFFLEEAVRTLVETKVLAGEPGGFRLARPTQGFQVPVTVHAMLAARIDRLAPNDKRLLQCAAVVGKDVPLALLRAVADEDEETLGGAVSHLQAAEFIYETNLFPDPEYTFKHALTHEVAYGSLLAEQRRALHARIVQAMETLYAGRIAEQIERLAHHASHGELWPKALSYLRQAGGKAAARSAQREAVVYLEQALAVLGRLPDSFDRSTAAIDVYLDLRNSLYPLGAFERIHGHLRDAEHLAQALDDRRRLCRVLLYLSQHHWWAGDPESALETVQRALAIATAVRDSTLEILARYYLGVYHHTFGDYRAAIEALESGLALITEDLVHDRFGGPGLLSVFLRSWLIQCHVERGEFAEAVARGSEGLAIAVGADSPYSIAQVSFSIGFLHLRRGDFSSATAFHERGTDVCRRWHIQIWFPRLSAALGFARARAGGGAEALALLEEAIERATEMKTLGRHVLPLVWLGEAYLSAGRLDEAAEAALRAVGLAQSHKEHGHEAWGLRALGNIAAAGAVSAIPGTAEEYYGRALALARERSMRPLMAHCHLDLGRLHARAGDPSAAETHLATAADLFREMDMGRERDEAETLRRTL